MTWFKDLTGMIADDPASVRNNITVDGSTLICAANKRRIDAGTLTTPSLAELRQPVPNNGPISVRECVADIGALHTDPANAHAMFQVASQFNLLEMVSPDVTPEDGIARYAYDKTQGPACAMACGAGTIWRNYFHNGTGQSSDIQLDMLADMGRALGNTDARFWDMVNGYALPVPGALSQISSKITAGGRDTLKNLLRIGIQSETEVTMDNAGHLVSQAYCSALPISYSQLPPTEWEPFARLILDATYEATFFAALRNYKTNGSNKLYLTLLGGGAFGNPTAWIIAAIQTNIARFALSGLDVKIVSYLQPNHALAPFLTRSH